MQFKGLKQESRRWYKFDFFMLNHGYSKTNSAFVFVKWFYNGDLFILLFYVDDMFIVDHDKDDRLKES